MRKPQFVALLILIGALSLTACGQKGPLYLPAQTSAQAPESPAGTADSSDKKEKTEKKSTY